MAQMTRAAHERGKGSGRYAQRQSRPWSERHARHAVAVAACPHCNPDGDTARPVTGADILKRAIIETGRVAVMLAIAAACGAVAWTADAVRTGALP